MAHAGLDIYATSATARLHPSTHEVEIQIASVYVRLNYVEAEALAAQITDAAKVSRAYEETMAKANEIVQQVSA